MLQQPSLPPGQTDLVFVLSLEVQLLWKRSYFPSHPLGIHSFPSAFLLCPPITHPLETLMNDLPRLGFPRSCYLRQREAAVAVVIHCHHHHRGAFKHASSPSKLLVQDQLCQDSSTAGRQCLKEGLIRRRFMFELYTEYLLR